MGRTLNATDEKFTYVDCIICSSKNHKKVYASKQPTGDTLGVLDISLSCCDDCGFVWQNPQLKASVLAEYYAHDINASGAVYHDRNPYSKHSLKQEARIKFFQPLLQSMGGSKSIMEIGCSTGEFLMALDLPDWNLFGVEPSITAAKQASTQGITVHNCGIDDFDINQGQYDAIALFSVIEHLPNLPKVMKVISGGLKSGGLFFFEIPDSEKASAQLAEFFGYEHLWHFTTSSIELFLSQYGFGKLILDDSVKDSRLRGAVSKMDVPEVFVSETPPEKSMRNVIEYYSKERAELIEQVGLKIATFLNKHNIISGKSLAIYGAGIHTFHLFNHYPELLNSEVIIDSNPKKWGGEICGIPVVGLEQAGSLGLAAIIISSNSFESEIYLKIKSDLPQLCQHILRLYA